MKSYSRFVGITVAVLGLLVASSYAYGARRRARS